MRPRQLVSLGVQEDRFSTVAFSLDASIVVAATNPLEGEQQLVAWGYPSLEERWRVPISATVTAISFARSGTWLATSEMSNACVVRHMASGREIRGVDATSGCQPTVPLDDERLLFFTTADQRVGQLFIWSRRTGEVERVIEVPATSVSDLIVDAGGGRVAVAFYSLERRPNVWMMEISSSKLLHELDGAAGVRLAGFRANDTEVIAYNTLGSGPAIHEASTGRLLAVLGDRSLASIHGVALSSSGRWLATTHGQYVDNHRSFEDLCLCIWDLSERRLHRRIDLFGDPDTVLRFTADDTILATSSGSPITISSFGLDR